MKRRICIGLAVCVLCFVSVTEAHLVQTNFNGLTEGSIKLQYGTAVGFGGPWDASTGTIKAAKGYDLVAPAGTMFGLTQSGDPTIVTNTRVAGLSPRQQARLIDGSMDGTVWGSFLVKPSADSHIGIGFNDNDHLPGDTRFLTTDDGELWVDFDDGNDYDVNVPNAFAIGETSLVLFRIQIDANDANDYVSVWINPDLSNFGSETPVAIQEGADFVGSAITRLNVITYNHGGAADLDMITLSNGVDGYLDVTGSEGSSGSAYDPDPGNDANGIGTPNEATIDVVLSWKTGADPCGVETYNPAIKKHYLYMSADQNVSSDPNLYLVETIDVTGLVETSSTFALNYVGSYKWLVEEGLDDGAGGTYPSGDPNNLMGWVWWFETAVSPHYTAYNLDPEDEAIEVPVDKVLSWKEGDFANFHKIYFGTNFVDINERDEFTPFVLQAFNPLDPNTETYSPTLVSLTTFHWCIDEYNDITDTTWPCDKVYSFTTGSLEAFNPDPANFAKYVLLDKVLSWTAGADMSAPSHKHHVYFGTNETDVTNASDPCSPPGIGQWLNVGTTTYDPCGLDPGTTYYWRVDEDGAGGLHSGDVWEFTCTVNSDPNLVAWYQFDEDDPGIVYDTSGNGNHGEPRGGVGYAAGTYEQALDCDGSDDYVYTGKTALDLNIDVNKPKSTTAWVYTRAFNNCAIWHLDGAGEGAEWCLTATKVTNQWLVRHRGAYNYGFSYTSQNEWVHFALVYDGSVSTCYADGLPISSRTCDLNTSSDKPFQIGARVTGYFFDGLIDDVRIYDKELSQGEIGAIIRVDPAKAWKPRPVDGATDVPVNPTLMWNPGDYAPATFGHKVYFGADDPANMVEVPGQPQTPNNFDPGVLELGKTYYWAVDEVNGGGVDAGNTWSFTVIESLVVDDFEGYSGNMWQIWIDGAGDCAGDDTDSGSILYEEWVITYDSNGSMKYDYDNDGTVQNHPCGGDPLTRPKYSRGVAKIADLPSGIDPNWLEGSPKALVLMFQGVFINDPNEKMWVELTDDSGKSAKVTYGPPHLGEDDINDVTETSWHQWNIDLQEFVDSNGVSLAEVNAIAIGFGNPGETPSPGWGYGTMYFDDIRLYPARCLLENRDPCFARVDYTRDCVVDAEELDVMFGEWLLEAVFPPGGAENIWREAESADTLGTSWRVVTDPGALGGRTYIGSENDDGDDNDTAPGPEWIASYDINVAGGTYMVLVYARQVGSNSFWFRIVGATSQTHEDPDQPGTGWVNYEGVHFGNSWEWDEVHSNDHGKAIVNWTLPAGSVTLEVGKREDGVHLDGILITDNLALDPATMPPPVAISDLSGDKKVNFKDYAKLAERWLDDEGLFP